MDSLVIHWGDFGAITVMAMAAVGSAIGCGIAGMGAIGAWKKCYMQNKPAPYTLMVFAGAPMTQTFYGFITMLQLVGTPSSPENFMARLAAGIFGGLAMGMSAIYQGKAAAAASDAFAETGKGFANNIVIIGIVETIALFAMVFILLNVK